MDAARGPSPGPVAFIVLSRQSKSCVHDSKVHVLVDYVDITLLEALCSEKTPAYVFFYIYNALFIRNCSKYRRGTVIHCVSKMYQL